MIEQQDLRPHVRLDGTPPRRRKHVHHRFVVIVLATAGALVAVTGCGSGSSGGQQASPPSSGGTVATAASDASACLTKARSDVAPLEAPPTSLPLTPIATAPTKGVKVVSMVDSQAPTDQQRLASEKAAGTAAGWQVSGLSFNGSIEDLTAKMTQAIATKPRAIIVSGFTPGQLTRSLAAAKQAGISVVLNGALGSPTGTTGYAASTEGQKSEVQEAQFAATWLEADSGCKGKIGLVELPFPILHFFATTLKNDLATQCPDCSVKAINVQASDIGTPAGAQAVVSALQADPSLKYVYYTYGDASIGVTSALKQAGISVKISGQIPTPENIADLQDGTNAMWIDQSAGITGWLEIDSLIRVFEGGKPVNETQPLPVLTPGNVPSTKSNEVPVLPANYVDLFKRLWHVA